MSIKLISLCMILLVQLSAQGRVFSFDKEWFASYFRGTVSSSALGQEGFRYSSGETTTVNNEAGLTYSGEFGFLFNLGTKVTFRIGVEAIQGKTPTETTGSNAGGTKLFDLNHKVLIVNSLATLEFNYISTPTWRLFVAGGAGLASISMDNQYEMTATGISELGTNSYTEKGETSFLAGHVSTGVEALFVDAVTFMFEVGYRYLPVESLTHKHAGTVIGESGASKDVLKGAELKNHDGSLRAFDMSGVYAGLSFRFYIPL